MIREFIANSLIAAGVTIGQYAGLQKAIVLSEHSINVTMEQPDESNRAWDTSLYKHGNVFLDGYANPIKPGVEQNTGLENPDHVSEAETPEEGEGDADTADGPHTQLISSGRYRDYMRQDLISQLLTPESRWNKMLYGIIAVAALQFLGIIITLYATGSFQ